MDNHVNYKVLDEITYLLPNSNGCTDEGLEWVSYFMPHFTGHVITNLG